MFELTKRRNTALRLNPYLAEHSRDESSVLDGSEYGRLLNMRHHFSHRLEMKPNQDHWFMDQYESDSPTGRSRQEVERALAHWYLRGEIVYKPIWSVCYHPGPECRSASSSGIDCEQSVWFKILLKESHFEAEVGRDDVPLTETEEDGLRSFHDESIPGGNAWFTLD